MISNILSNIRDTGGPLPFLAVVISVTIVTRLCLMVVTDARNALRVYRTECVRRRKYGRRGTTADLMSPERAAADVAAIARMTEDEDAGLTTEQRAIADNKKAWEGHIPDDNIPDTRAERLAAKRNLADRVSAALEGETRKDREARRRAEQDAGEHGRVYYLTNLIAEVRVKARWKVLYEGSTLFPAGYVGEHRPSVAEWVLKEIRGGRLDFRLVPLDFRTPDDAKAERTASDYEAENFLNIAAE